MYERFTDHAQRVIELASQEARRLNHDFVGTDHLLLALVAVESEVAAKLLTEANIDADRIRLEVGKIMGPGPVRVISGLLPQTPRAKRAIEYALKEARDLDHHHVGTEHLLLGLLREQ